MAAVQLLADKVPAKFEPQAARTADAKLNAVIQYAQRVKVLQVPPLTLADRERVETLARPTVLRSEEAVDEFGF